VEGKFQSYLNFFLELRFYIFYITFLIIYFQEIDQDFLL